MRHDMRSAKLRFLAVQAEAFMQDSGRWRVKLASGAVKDLKPENLRVLEAKELQAESPNGNSKGSPGSPFFCNQERTGLQRNRLAEVGLVWQPWLFGVVIG